MPKEWLFLGVVFLLFLMFPRPSFSDSSLILYKFSSDNGTDWVEVYNPLANAIDLGGYFLEDGSAAGNKKTLDCLLKRGGYYSVDWGNSLNKSGDIISLKDSQSGLVDCVAYGNSSEICSGRDKVDLPQLSVGEYGLWTGSSWEISNNSDKVDNSDCLSPTLTPTSTPSPSPTPSPAVPTPSPEPTATSVPAAKAAYWINEVKNKDGETIPQVKIYVDGADVHHWAPETLEFCDGCYCDRDKKVACGFGEHTIRLEKNGYQSWSETKTISSGDSYQADPHLVLILPTASPTPTLVPTPTLTPTPTTTLTPTASSSGQLVFGNEATGEGEVKGERDVFPASGSGKNGRLDLAGLPLIFIGGGTIMVGVYFWLEKKGEGFSDETEIKNNKF